MAASWFWGARNAEKAQAPPTQGGARFRSEFLAYAFSLRRSTPARPTSPVPRSVKEPGSGTVDMLVSPLEIRVEPLKNPLPVLMVSWIVAPLTVLPLNHVPVSEPLRV